MEERKCDLCPTRHCEEQTGVNEVWKLMRHKDRFTEFGHILGHTRERIEDCGMRKFLEGDQPNILG